MKVELNTTDKRGDIESMTLIPSLSQKPTQLEKSTSTQESVLETNPMTYPTKSNTSEKDTQIISLSKTMVADSTSNEKALTGYWKKSCLGMSKKLLSLTKTGSVGSDLTCSNSLQNTSIQNSWFSTSLQSPLKKSLSKTLFPSSMCSPVEFMDSGNTLTKSRKIRIYPNKEDLPRFRQYLGLSRYWYNQAVAYLKKPGTRAYLPEVRRTQNLQHPDWALNCPQRIRDHAMSDACKAVKQAKVKFKQTRKPQTIDFRKRRDTSQRFNFDRQSLSDNYVFGMKKYRLRFYATETFNSELEGSKITYQSGRWFLILPIKVTIKFPESQRKGVVSLDPGVRTFQTLYSPCLHGKVGEECFSKIYRLCVRLDQVIAKMATPKSRRSLRRVSQRLRWKIKDLISDIHHKLAFFLVTNFDKILIPSFETSTMVTKLRSKTARSMLTWAHYRFKTFLKFKAREYSAEVVEVNESYTSKTCSYCGQMQNIGSKKILKCSCGANVDRDYNGARGIYLKNISASNDGFHLLGRPLPNITVN